MCNYLSIAKYNLRFNLLLHIVAAMGLLILIPILFGITALDATMVALPLELGLPFIGIILLTPMYSLEQESGMVDTIRVRKTPYLFVCGIRIIMVTALMFIFICGFVFLMSTLESEVSLAHAMASFSNAVFLGGLGILVSSIINNVVIGYMTPILFFLIDLMGGFGSFTLFSMMKNGSIDGKLSLIIIGICCIIVSLFYKSIMISRR